MKLPIVNNFIHHFLNQWDRLLLICWINQMGNCYFFLIFPTIFYWKRAVGEGYGYFRLLLTEFQHSSCKFKQEGLCTLRPPDQLCTIWELEHKNFQFCSFKKHHNIFLCLDSKTISFQNRKARALSWKLSNNRQIAQ